MLEAESFVAVIHLAALAGVRHSFSKPYLYLNYNICNFYNVLEACEKGFVKHLIYASSSSVYGDSTEIPLSVSAKTDAPVSFYAATKKANEVMAHSFSSMYGLQATGLRFFTVYGPYGRPDMAIFKFTKAIFEGDVVELYNHGDMTRDFTYVDDVVEAIVKLIPKYPQELHVPHRILNVGTGQPVKLAKVVSLIEKAVGKKASCVPLPIQKGDVLRTCADITELKELTGFSPKTTIEEGIHKFVDWYKTYYNA